MTESEKNIISFMETLQYLYFVKRDMDALYQLLDPHISWIGTGNWEICTCLKDAQEMLLKDKAEHKEGFDILESHYRILTQSNLFCSVSGRIRIRDSNSSPLAMDQDLRPVSYTHLVFSAASRSPTSGSPAAAAISITATSPGRTP